MIILFLIVIMLQCRVSILNVTSISISQVKLCKSNPCETKAEVLDCTECLVPTVDVTDLFIRSSAPSTVRSSYVKRIKCLEYQREQIGVYIELEEVCAVIQRCFGAVEVFH